ncbi:MAG: hypothetical protein WBA87_09290 [Microbacterium sp.]
MTDPTRADRRAALIAAGAIADDNTTVELDATAYRPDVSERTRGVVYFTTLATAAASALASGIAGIWFPDIAAQVLATGGVATTVMGIIGGGVGVIYRPAAQR